MMSSENVEKQSQVELKANNIIAEIIGIIEWLLIALILALLFRSFIMEAYRIPTGSMAETLNGDHFRLRCHKCGYRFDHGFDTAEHGLARYSLPVDGKSTPRRCRCPSCGHDLQFYSEVAVDSGDRILVLKCLYQFLKPKRWDVTVFKDPQDPGTNIVKRLIAMPGETVEIIDGDIYIDGLIMRKPPLIQQELWVPVFDNDYQPVSTDIGFFNNHKWEQPFNNIGSSGWKSDKADPTKLVLEDGNADISWMEYDTSAVNSFRAGYAYNDSADYEYAPNCSDIMVRFDFLSGDNSRIGVELVKYGIRYRAWIDNGKMAIALVDANDAEMPLAFGDADINEKGKATHFSFTNVDHLLIFESGKTKLRIDLGRESDAMGVIDESSDPQVKIFGSGKIALSHLAIYRDIHYTVREFGGMGALARAAQDRPFKLEPDEFFMLGDNSPSSYDSRWWEQKGRGNNGQKYRAGCVPREYLVGKAVFVYWPSGFKPFKNGPAAVPNVGRMRFIYGGSRDQLQ